MRDTCSAPVLAVLLIVVAKGHQPSIIVMVDDGARTLQLMDEVHEVGIAIRQHPPRIRPSVPASNTHLLHALLLFPAFHCCLQLPQAGCSKPACVAVQLELRYKYRLALLLLRCVLCRIKPALQDDWQGPVKCRRDTGWRCCCS
jgi:hypothetical protein